MGTMQSMQAVPIALGLTNKDPIHNPVSTAPTLRLKLEEHMSNGVTTEKKWKPPRSAWISQLHPHAEDVAHEVDQYFLKNWKFPSPKSERTFVRAGFSTVTCLYFPTAMDDRIQYACRLLTVLFLIDGAIVRFLRR